MFLVVHWLGDWLTYIMTVRYKQLADEVLAKSRIIKVEESVINRAERPRLITLNTETLIIILGYHKNLIKR